MWKMAINFRKFARQFRGGIAAAAAAAATGGYGLAASASKARNALALGRKTIIIEIHLIAI